MKKLSIFTISLFFCLSLSACSFSNQSQKSKSQSREESSLVKANSILKKKIKKKSEKSNSVSSSINSNTNGVSNQNQAQTQQSNVGKSQSEINRERGYDPNGNPLLPGQDHAAGSNPDGSPDAWVQWQIDHENDTTFPDGTPTPGSQRTPEENASIENDY